MPAQQHLKRNTSSLRGIADVLQIAARLTRCAARAFEQIRPVKGARQRRGCISTGIYQDPAQSETVLATAMISSWVLPWRQGVVEKVCGEHTERPGKMGRAWCETDARRRLHLPLPGYGLALSSVAGLGSLRNRGRRICFCFLVDNRASLFPGLS